MLTDDQKTIDYLFNEVVGSASSLGSVHHFVWDRTRAIRNDFSIQQITKPADVEIAVECYERIARFHIVSLHQFAVPGKPYDRYDWYQEREQLDRTLLSLAQYYDDNRAKPACRNEAEFRAYAIIFQIQSPSPDMEERLNGWTREVKTNPRVQIALDMYAAASSILHPQGPLKPFAQYPVARQDWSAFFDAIESRKVSYLMACVAEIYFNLVRKIILASVCCAFKRGSSDVADILLGRLTNIMHFDSNEETRKFCQSHGLRFNSVSGSASEEYLALDSLSGKELPDPKTPLAPQTFSRVVENKRFGRSLPAVINGFGVAKARAAGLVNVGDSMQDQNMSSNVQASAPMLSSAASTPFAAFSNTVSDPNKPKSHPFASVGAAGPQSSSLFSSPFAKPNTTHGGSTGTSPFAQKSTVSSQPAAISHSSSPFAASSATPNPFAQLSQNNISSGQTKPANPLSESIFAPPKSNNSNFITSQASASPWAPSQPASNNMKPSQPASPFALPQTSDVGPKPQPGQNPAPASFSWGTITPAPSSSTAPSPTRSDQQTSSVATSTPTAQTAPFAPLGVPKQEVPYSATVTSSTPTSLFSAPVASVKPSSLFAAPTQPSSLFQAPTVASSVEKQAASPAQSFPSAAQPQSGLPKTQHARAPLFAPPPAQQSTTPASSPVPAASTPKPLFHGGQFNQPKKPSPLSKSFTANTYPTTENSTTPDGTPTAPPAGLMVGKPKLQTDQVLHNLAKEVLLDPDRGLLVQFVEFHCRSVIMKTYDQLYEEDLRNTADAFRRDTLAVRYGKRWRQTSWSLKLLRQGRAKREKRRTATRNREVVQRHIQQKEKINAVDDFLASRVGRTEDDLSMSRLGSSFMSNASGTSHARSRLSARANSVSHAPPLGVELGTVQESAPDAHDRPLTTPARSQESHFLGFRVSGSTKPGTNASKPSASRSTYFRMKAMGLLAHGTPVRPPNLKKRAREDDDGGKASPAHKRSRTPPRSVSHSIRRPSIQSRSSPLAFSSPRESSVATSRPMSKAEEEDELLFARARAAREALADSAEWYRNESRNADDAASARSEVSSFAPERRVVSAESVASHDWLDESVASVPAYRLRESRFVPRDNYVKAIDIAKRTREQRMVAGGASTPVMPHDSIPIEPHAHVHFDTLIAPAPTYLPDDQDLATLAEPPQVQAMVDVPNEPLQFDTPSSHQSPIPTSIEQEAEEHTQQQSSVSDVQSQEQNVSLPHKPDDIEAADFASDAIGVYSAPSMFGSQTQSTEVPPLTSVHFGFGAPSIPIYNAPVHNATAIKADAAVGHVDSFSTDPQISTYQPPSSVLFSSTKVSPLASTMASAVAGVPPAFDSVHEVMDHESVGIEQEDMSAPGSDVDNNADMLDPALASDIIPPPRVGPPSQPQSSGPSSARQIPAPKKSPSSNPFALLAEEEDEDEDEDDDTADDDASNEPPERDIPPNEQASESESDSDSHSSESVDAGDVEESFVNNAELQDSDSEIGRPVHISRGSVSGRDSPAPHDTVSDTSDGPPPRDGEDASTARQAAIDRLRQIQYGQQDAVYPDRDDLEREDGSDVDEGEDGYDSAFDEDDEDGDELGLHDESGEDDEDDDDDDAEDDEDDDDDDDNAESRHRMQYLQHHHRARIVSQPPPMNSQQLQDSGMVKGGSGTADDALELSD